MTWWQWLLVIVFTPAIVSCALVVAVVPVCLAWQALAWVREDLPKVVRR